MHLTRALAAVAGLTVLAGCGSQGGSDGATPSASHVETTQTAAAPIVAVSRSLDIANDSIVKDGTGSAGPAGADGIGTRSHTDFHFTANGSVSVNLDLQDGAGNDLYPNATGSVTIAWTGDVVLSQPSGTGGVADYAVTLTYDTECVFTDPLNGNTATVAPGGVLSYALEVSWQRTSDEDWSVETDATHGVDGFAADVVADGVSVDVTLEGSRHVAGILKYLNGVWTVGKTVTSHWEATFTHGTATHTVVWNRPSLNRIFITVDGVQYGPYTLAQVRAEFGCNVDGGD